MWLLGLLAGLASAADVVVVTDAAEAAPGTAAEVVAEIRALSTGRTLDIQVRYAGYDAATASRLLKAAEAEKPKVIVAVGALCGTLASLGEVTQVPVVTANPVVPGATQDPANVTTVRIQADVSEALADLGKLTGDPAPGVRLAVAEDLLPLARRALPGANLIALSATPPPRTDARGVLVGPTGHLSEAVRRERFAAWRDAGYVLLVLDATAFPEGAAGAYIRDEARNPVARRVALTTLDRLDGRKTPPTTAHLPRGDLTLSIPDLRRLGVDPPFDLLAEADLRGLDGVYERADLPALIAEAVANSPTLASVRARIERDNTEVARSVSAWLPDADLGSTLTQLDSQLKSAVQSTTGITADLTVQQLLYNDAARANLGIQAALRRSREAELVAAEQDLALDVAVAYVSLLRTRAVIDIRDVDLDRVRLSLEVARQRERAGDASKVEVLRWEAEVANARAALVQAWTDFVSVQVQLNQVCGARVDRPILPVDSRVGQEIAERLQRPGQVRAVSGAAEALAVDRAPERRQLGEVLDALERARGIARRAYIMPTVAGQFTVNGNIYQSPRDEIILPGSSEPVDLAPQPDLYWGAGVNATVPVFSGGALRADQRRAEADLASSEAQLRNLDLALRGRARVAVQQAHGASVQAGFRKTSADTALRALQAALDAYAAGAANQTTVTEARSNAVQTQLLANDAEFQTSLEVYELLRAVGSMPTPRDPSAATTARDVLTASLEGP